METNPENTLLVWDAEGPPPSGEWTRVLWSGFAEVDDSSVISIPMLVEAQADALRARYLAWIYELGETEINNKRLVDHLELRGGFSYWWMTLVTHMFNASESSQIDNAIKALVLESLVAEYRPKSMVLASNNNRLASTLLNLCQNLKIGFHREYAKPAKRTKPTARLVYSALPSPVRAFVYLLWYWFRSLSFWRTKQVPVSALDGEVTFIDVLVHLGEKSFTKGEFVSNYWTSLVDELGLENGKTNWMHNYFKHKKIASYSQAKDLIVAFNDASNGMQSHALIEENLSLSVFIKALRDYFRINWCCFQLSEIRFSFTPTGSALDLWPLLKNDWIESIRGSSAMLNCLRLCLYEKTFNQLPYQKLGVYIQENQSWEMALIHAWKAAGHGKLIGVPHTTVRFWDLRYYYDPASYARTGKNGLPMPDQVAVNGPIAKQTYVRGGYPESQLAEVEALRFLHLLNSAKSDASIKTSSRALKVLVCGDFQSTTNDKILSWLASAAKSLPPETAFLLKPHPAFPFKLSDSLSLSYEVSDAPLVELFAHCDVVFTSNITSAAVEAYCSGVPVVQMWDGKSFNLSPLRGLNAVVYVKNPMELKEALFNAQIRDCWEVEPYFFVDERLPRWRKLLGCVPNV